MGLPATCPAPQLLLDWTFDLDDGSWILTGPGWTINNGQLIFTAQNEGDTAHQNWPYTADEYQRSSMYISQRDIDGWFYLGQAIDHLGHYTAILKTTEPPWPADFVWLGGGGNPGDKMIVDWSSQMSLARYLACRYSLLDFDDQLYNLTALPDGRYMLQYVSIESGSSILLIYDPTLDDSPL